MIHAGWGAPMDLRIVVKVSRNCQADRARCSGCALGGPACTRPGMLRMTDRVIHYNGTHWLTQSCALSSVKAQLLDTAATMQPILEQMCGANATAVAAAAAEVAAASAAAAAAVAVAAMQLGGAIAGAPTGAAMSPSACCGSSSSSRTAGACCCEWWPHCGCPATWGVLGLPFCWCQLRCNHLSVIADSGCLR
jgi:hypothetical protein